MLLPPIVCRSWLLVVGGQVQGSRLCVQEEGCCTKCSIPLLQQKMVGSITDGVIKICHVLKPSGSTTALGSTQSLTEMSTRNTSWGLKVAGA